MTSDLQTIATILETEPVIFQLLKQCPYEILRMIRVRCYRDGEFELAEGQIHHHFYIIVRGEVDIYSESEYGKKYFLTTYHTGNFIGEMEIFQQLPYISHVQGRGQVTVLELERSLLLRWMSLDQNFNRLFIQKICESSYQMCERMKRNNLYNLKQRICYYLLEQFDLRNQRDIIWNSEEMSQKMAVTQRSVNRVLKELREQGIIYLSQGKIHLINRSKLETLLR
ncbi:Crp/Fnr family transcriptional regulator [Streptococcus respiraculi]|uniref:Crp/Fnr family transcriptional regulator n=1 Tax=Streptococcus respiraculi TaxID=2021971 RepID=UPI000E728180|nr:Crp/Fnr family transcriptional regulator [Streptococcus respiraculi]